MTTTRTPPSDDSRTAQQILDALDVTVDELDEAASTVHAIVELFDNQRPCVTDVTLDDGTALHKFQAVRHEMELPFGDNERTDWVITKIDVMDREVTMKVPGPWDSTTVTFDEITGGNYTPLTHSGGTPVFGY